MRIFLIGLSEGFARSMARYLGDDQRVVLAGVAPSVALADLMLSSTYASLALVDWSALGGTPRDSFRVLRRGRPSLRILCVVEEHAAYRAVALAAGADAVSSRDGFAEEFEILLPRLLGECGAPDGGHHA